VLGLGLSLAPIDDGALFDLCTRYGVAFAHGALTEHRSCSGIGPGHSILRAARPHLPHPILLDLVLRTRNAIFDVILSLAQPGLLDRRALRGVATFAVAGLYMTALFLLRDTPTSFG